MAEKKKRKIKMDIAMVVLMVIGFALFLLSYTTGYYVFGQMHSVMITVCLFAALIAEMAGAYVREGHPDKEWPHLFMTAVIVLICWAVGMILLDRVEAIGTCVITDFDSGHGGEEAVYMCLVAVLFFLAAVVLGIIKSFLGRGSVKVVETDAD